MQTIRLLLIAIVLTLCGCQSQMAAQPPSDNARPDTSIYDDAIETIATSQDEDSLLSADKTLRAGGLTAVALLREHLSDHRVPRSNYLTRAVSGTSDMGDHCFWLIQDMIEAPVPKLYASLYSSLNRANVAEWLDDRSGAALAELQIAAASQSLELAQTDFERNANPHAKKALAIYTERLNKLKAQVEKGRPTMPRNC